MSTHLWSSHKVSTNMMKISNSLVVLAYDDQDDEEDARNWDCDEKNDEGRHSHQNKDTTPIKIWKRRIAWSRLWHKESIVEMLKEAKQLCYAWDPLFKTSFVAPNTLYLNMKKRMKKKTNRSFVFPLTWVWGSTPPNDSDIILDGNVVCRNFTGWLAMRADSYTGLPVS